MLQFATVLVAAAAAGMLPSTITSEADGRIVLSVPEGASVVVQEVTEAGAVVRGPSPLVTQADLDALEQRLVARLAQLESCHPCETIAAVEETQEKLQVNVTHQEESIAALEEEQEALQFNITQQETCENDIVAALATCNEEWVLVAEDVEWGSTGDDHGVRFKVKLHTRSSSLTFFIFFLLLLSSVVAALRVPIPVCLVEQLARILQKLAWAKL
jgi:hypothetical protein